MSDPRTQASALSNNYPGLAGAEIKPARGGLMQALREMYAMAYTPGMETPDHGLETTAITEPLKNWAQNDPTLRSVASVIPGGDIIRRVAGGMIPGTRGEALVTGAQVALPVAGLARGPQLVQVGETAADDLINVFRWGDDRLAPGNWVEAGTGSKPIDYLLSTKWAPSMGGSQFAPYSSGVSHVVRRGDLAPATGVGSTIANAMGQRRYAPSF